MGSFGGVVPPQAHRSALVWVTPGDTDFFTDMHLFADVTADVTYTEETASYVQAGFDRESASAGYAGCSASFEREHKERHAQASDTKHISMIGRSYYPRAKLFLEDCTATSQKFIDAVKDALKPLPDTNASQADIDAAVAALSTVFDAYGTAIPSEVTLGGQLVFVHTEDGTGTVNEDSAETTIRTAVSVKMGGAASDASFAIGTSTSSRLTATALASKSSFTGLGGDTTLVSSPAIWPPTVKPAANWAVIGRGKLRSVVELLPADLKARVYNLLPPPAPLSAILDPRPLSGTAQSFQAKTDTFVIAMRDTENQDAINGTVSLACGPSESPADNLGAVAGGASVHRYDPYGTCLQHASVCLPFPKDQYAQVVIKDITGTPNTHLVRIDNRLSLGAWVQGLPTSNMNADNTWKAPTDGFIFCAMSTGGTGPRGYVTCSVGDRLLGAASVHEWFDDGENVSIPKNSFCVPVLEGAIVKLDQVATAGNPPVQVWWLPITSPDWKLGTPVSYCAGTVYQQPESGFLTGVIKVGDLGGRVNLRLTTALDTTALTTTAPPAGASVESVRGIIFPSVRFITHNSAMLPVSAGAACRADCAGPDGALTLTWTPIVRK